MCHFACFGDIYFPRLCLFSDGKCSRRCLVSALSRCSFFFYLGLGHGLTSRYVFSKFHHSGARRRCTMHQLSIYYGCFVVRSFFHRRIGNLQTANLNHEVLSSSCSSVDALPFEMHHIVSGCTLATLTAPMTALDGDGSLVRVDRLH